MGPQTWKVLSAIAIILQITAAQAETGVELEAMVAGPWHHLPRAVDTLQFNRDMAKCRLMALQTPVNSDTAAVVAIVRNTAQINCLKALGYESGNAAPSTPAKPPDTTYLATKIDRLNCAQYTRMRKLPGTPGKLSDLVFFAWARGFLDAWNVSTKEAVLRVDLNAMSETEQQKFIQTYCGENPSKSYIEGIMALAAKLKAEKVKSTGMTEEPN